MNILDIAIAKKLAGGGGGSGTDNYNDLSNLPKINDTTLSGNKSSSALGLQSEINSDSKLASDLVDDTNQDNKFVTSTEKNTWNAKQNAIDADHKINADYVDDSTSTNKFVTSTEKNTWNAKQNAIDSDHKLSSSLVSFSAAEAAALASGIDSSKVGQISTNQTNILYATENGGGLNLLHYDAIDTTNANGVQYTINDDMSITATRTATSSNVSYIILKLSGADVDVADLCDGTNWLVGTPSGGLTTKYRMYATGGSGASGYLKTDYGDGVQLDATTLTSGIQIVIRIESSYNAQNLVFKPMITKHRDALYQPYALPNYDLTRLEAEDRASLAEVVDSGAKNKFDISTATFDAYGGTCSVTYNSNSSATIKQVSGGTNLRLPGFVTRLEAGTYILSGCPSGGNDSTYRLDLRSMSGSSVGDVIGGSNDYGSGSVPFTITTAGNYYIAVRFASGYTVPTAGITFKPMICTKAAFCLSSKFVPYKVDTTKPWALLKSGDDLNDIVSAMEAKNVYVMFATGDTGVSNKPANGIFMVRTTNLGGGAAVQEVTMLTGNDRDKSYVRTFIDNNNWSTWKQTTNV